MQKKHFTFTLILFICLMFIGSSIFNVYGNANTIDQRINCMKSETSNHSDKSILQETNDTLPSRPILSIRKSINATIDDKTYKTEPNQWLKVTIVIKNIGNRTAYNLTITEPLLPSLVSKTIDYYSRNFVEVDINATIYFDYYLLIVKEGKFAIESTTIEYQNNKGHEYSAYSQRFELTSILPEKVEIIEADLWLNVLWYSLAIGGFFIIIITTQYIYEKIQEGKSKKSKKSKEPARKISEAKKKRKIEKRKK